MQRELSVSWGESTGKRFLYVNPTPDTAGAERSPDPFHLASGLHHGKRFPATPVPEVDLIGSGNQQELSRGVESQGGNGIVAICEPALTATL